MHNGFPQYEKEKLYGIEADTVNLIFSKWILENFYAFL